jgi:superfamily II DNA or RNA helicase
MRRAEGRKTRRDVGRRALHASGIAAFDYLRACERAGTRPRLLFLAHRREILEQARATFRQVLRDGAFGELYVDGDLPEKWEHVFATIQSAAGHLGERTSADHFRFVVVDECHPSSGSIAPSFASTVSTRRSPAFRAVGSRARGDHRVDSDVDVAVLGDVDRLALSAELSRATGHEVDVVDLADPGYPLLSAVIADGILIHEGVPASYGRWRSHALSQLDLDRAWYARMRDGFIAKLAAGAR